MPDCCVWCPSPDMNVHDHANWAGYCSTERASVRTEEASAVGNVILFTGVIAIEAEYRDHLYVEEWTRVR